MTARSAKRPVDGGDADVILTLFEVHHRQLQEKRQRIHTITYRTVALFLAMTGWLVSSKAPESPLRYGLLPVAVGVITLMANWIVWQHNATYVRICGVVRRLNEALGLFEKGRYVPNKALYPVAWRDFGGQGRLQVVWHHLLVITLTAALCIVAALAR
jgi:hypothetical protein